jgi:hypothetical protein
MGFDPSREPDDTKLRELILFIAERSAGDELFGSTKLNKLLFFADFLAFVKLGSSITGHAYQRLPNGPAPKQMLPIMKGMVSDRELAIQKRDFYGRTQNVPVALRPSRLKDFSADEIAVVTEVLDLLQRKNAKGISSLSHEFEGWKLAKENELIPYQTALVHFKKPRKCDIQKALDMSEELAALQKDCVPDADY